jgi:hypothetical protein
VSIDGEIPIGRIAADPTIMVPAAPAPPGAPTTSDALLPPPSVSPMVLLKHQFLPHRVTAAKSLRQQKEPQ